MRPDVINQPTIATIATMAPIPMTIATVVSGNVPSTVCGVTAVSVAINMGGVLVGVFVNTTGAAVVLPSGGICTFATIVADGVSVGVDVLVDGIGV